MSTARSIYKGAKDPAWVLRQLTFAGFACHKCGRLLAAGARRCRLGHLWRKPKIK